MKISERSSGSRSTILAAYQTNFTVETDFYYAIHGDNMR
jgi:hypothetical protein